MRERVGVLNLLSDGREGKLKRYALLFDRVCVPGFESSIDFIRKYNKIFTLNVSEYEIAEWDWLYQSGMIFDQENIWHSHLNDNSEFDKYQTEQENISNWITSFAPKRQLIAQDIDNVEFLMIKHSILALRKNSLLLRHKLNIDAYTVLPLTQLNIEEKADNCTIVQIVIDSLPIPNDQTPWEQILEIRQDHEMQAKLLALKQWMREIAKKELTPIEIEEQLEWLIYDYRRHMNLHKMKVDTGAFETVIVTAAELIEDLAKFKWGKAAKSLFSIKERRIALLEGEINAPGSEVAYIVKTREQFSNSRLTTVQKI